MNPPKWAELPIGRPTLADKTHKPKSMINIPIQRGIAIGMKNM